MCEMDQQIDLSKVKNEPPESVSEYIHIEIKSENVDHADTNTELEKEAVDQKWTVTCGSMYDTLVVCKEEKEEPVEVVALDKEHKNDVRNLFIKEENGGKGDQLSMCAKSKTLNNNLGSIKRSKNHEIMQSMDQKILPSNVKDGTTVVMKETLENIKIEYEADDDTRPVTHESLNPKSAESCENGFKSGVAVCKEELCDNRLQMAHPQPAIHLLAASSQTKRPRLAKKSKKINYQERPTSLEYSNNFKGKLTFQCANKADSVKMGTQTGKKTFTCIICDYKCGQKKNLINHMMGHTGEKPFSCNICSYKSRYKAHLVIHKRSHTGEKPFPCSYCKYAFSRKQNLVKHIRTHTGEKPFACTVCTYICSQKQHLVSHMRTHTGEKPFSCNICSYRSTYKTHLVDHLRSHTGEKSFSCSLCDFKCGLRQNLVQHERTHSGEKPFSCNLCDFKCGRKQNLVTHMRTHTGEKPFSCSICDYKCGRKQNLIDHVRTHTGEKPFSCTFCDNKFGRKQTLVKHMRIHTGEKPYSCDICDYRTRCKTHLFDHMRTHTGEKPFSCDLCNYKCIQKRHLVNHMSSRHLR